MRFEKLAQQREERDIKARLVTASLTGAQTGTSTNIPEGYTKITALTSGTGVITVVYRTPFVRLPIITATAFHATLKLYSTVTAQALDGCTIKWYDEGGVARDPTQMHFKAEGFDVADQV